MLGRSAGDSPTFITQGDANSTPVVRDHALISSSGWGTSFDAGRYLDFQLPKYAPSAATVIGATFSFGYRSLDAVGTTCYYVAVYPGDT